MGSLGKVAGTSRNKECYVLFLGERGPRGSPWHSSTLTKADFEENHAWKTRKDFKPLWKGYRLQSSHLTFAVLIQSNPLNGPGSNQVFIGKYILVISLQWSVHSVHVHLKMDKVDSKKQHCEKTFFAYFCHPLIK